MRIIVMKIKQNGNTMIKKILSTTLVSTMILINSHVIANPAHISQRQWDQRNRIIQKFYSGKLSINEIKRLVRQQQRIHRKKRRFKSNAYFNHRKHLHLNLIGISKNIDWQKHKHQFHYRPSIRKFRINKRLQR